VLFKDGQVVQRLNGYQPRDRITEKLQPFLEG
jgi:thioredoxin-like negative regulator of GroEL